MLSPLNHQQQQQPQSAGNSYSGAAATLAAGNGGAHPFQSNNNASNSVASVVVEQQQQQLQLLTALLQQQASLQQGESGPLLPLDPTTVQLQQQQLRTLQLQQQVQQQQQHLQLLRQQQQQQHNQQQQHSTSGMIIGSAGPPQPVGIANGFHFSPAQVHGSNSYATSPQHNTFHSVADRNSSSRHNSTSVNRNQFAAQHTNSGSIAGRAAIGGSGADAVMRFTNNNNNSTSAMPMTNNTNNNNMSSTAAGAAAPIGVANYLAAVGGAVGHQTHYHSVYNNTNNTNTINANMSHNNNASMNTNTQNPYEGLTIEQQQQQMALALLALSTAGGGGLVNMNNESSNSNSYFNSYSYNNNNDNNNATNTNTTNTNNTPNAADTPNNGAADANAAGGNAINANTAAATQQSLNAAVAAANNTNINNISVNTSVSQNRYQTAVGALSGGGKAAGAVRPSNSNGHTTNNNNNNNNGAHPAEFQQQQGSNNNNHTHHGNDTPPSAVDSPLHFPNRHTALMQVLQATTTGSSSAPFLMSDSQQHHQHQQQQQLQSPVAQNGSGAPMTSHNNGGSGGNVESAGNLLFQRQLQQQLQQEYNIPQAGDNNFQPNSVLQGADCDEAFRVANLQRLQQQQASVLAQQQQQMSAMQQQLQQRQQQQMLAAHPTLLPPSVANMPPLLPGGNAMLMPAQPIISGSVAVGNYNAAAALPVGYAYTESHPAEVSAFAGAAALATLNEHETPSPQQINTNNNINTTTANVNTANAGAAPPPEKGGKEKDEDPLKHSNNTALNPLTHATTHRNSAYSALMVSGVPAKRDPKGRAPQPRSKKRRSDAAAEQQHRPSSSDDDEEVGRRRSGGDSPRAHREAAKGRTEKGGEGDGRRGAAAYAVRSSSRRSFGMMDDEIVGTDDQYNNNNTASNSKGRRKNKSSSSSSFVSPSKCWDWCCDCTSAFSWSEGVPIAINAFLLIILTTVVTAIGALATTATFSMTAVKELAEENARMAFTICRERVIRNVASPINYAEELQFSLTVATPDPLPLPPSYSPTEQNLPIVLDPTDASQTSSVWDPHPMNTTWYRRWASLQMGMMRHSNYTVQTAGLGFKTMDYVGIVMDSSNPHRMQLGFGPAILTFPNGTKTPPALVATIVEKSNGAFVSVREFQTSYNLTKRSWFSNTPTAKGSVGRWDNVAFSSFPTFPTVTYARAIFNTNGDYVATTSYLVGLNELDDAFEAEIAKVGRGLARAYLIDNKGHLIASSLRSKPSFSSRVVGGFGDSYVLTPEEARNGCLLTDSSASVTMVTCQETPLTIGDAALADLYLSDHQYLTSMDVPASDDVFAVFSDGLHTSQRRLDGDNYFVLISPLAELGNFANNNMNWRLVILLRESDVTEPVLNGLYVAAGVTVAIVVGIALICALVAQFTFIRPLKAVALNMTTTAFWGDVGSGGGASSETTMSSSNRSNSKSDSSGGFAVPPKDARSASYFSEVAQIQRAYWAMADELGELKAYIPEHVLRTRGDRYRVESDTDGDDVEMGGVPSRDRLGRRTAGDPTRRGADATTAADQLLQSTDDANPQIRHYLYPMGTDRGLQSSAASEAYLSPPRTDHNGGGGPSSPTRHVLLNAPAGDGGGGGGHGGAAGAVDSSSYRALYPSSFMAPPRGAGNTVKAGGGIGAVPTTNGVARAAAIDGAFPVAILSEANNNNAVGGAVAAGIPSSALVVVTNSAPNAQPLPSVVVTPVAALNDKGALVPRPPSSSAAMVPMHAPDPTNDYEKHPIFFGDNVLVDRDVSVVVVNVVQFHNFVIVNHGPDITRRHAEIVKYLYETARRCGGILENFSGDRFLVSFNATSKCNHHTIAAVCFALEVSSVMNASAIAQMKKLAASAKKGGNGNHKNDGDEEEGDGGSKGKKKGGKKGGGGGDDKHQVFRAAPCGVSCGVSTGRALVGPLGTDVIRRHSILSNAIPDAMALERMVVRYPNCAVAIGGDTIPLIDGYFQYLLLDASLLPSSMGKRRRIAAVKGAMCAPGHRPEALRGLGNLSAARACRTSPYEGINGAFNAFLEGRNEQCAAGVEASLSTIRHHRTQRAAIEREKAERKRLRLMYSTSNSRGGGGRAYSPAAGDAVDDDDDDDADGGGSGAEGGVGGVDADFDAASASLLTEEQCVDISVMCDMLQSLSGTHTDGRLYETPLGIGYTPVHARALFIPAE